MEYKEIEEFLFDDFTWWVFHVELSLQNQNKWNKYKNKHKKWHNTKLLKGTLRATIPEAEGQSWKPDEKKLRAVSYMV